MDGRLANPSYHCASLGRPERQLSAAKRKSRCPRRAGDGDVSDGRRAGKLAGLRFEPVERGRDLEPVGREVLLGLLRVRAGLLAEPQHDRLHEAVAECLASQGRKARARIGREQLGSIVQRVEVLADHARIVERAAIVEHQRRDLVERVHRHHLGVRRRRRHHHPLRADAPGQPHLVRRHHHLAHERRPRRPEQLHGRNHPPSGAQLRSPASECSRRTAENKPRLIGSAAWV